MTNRRLLILAATQTPDDMIQLLSGGQHYRLNLASLTTPAEARP